MHGVHKSIAELMQPATLPAARAAERTSGVQESFGLAWQKAVNAAAPQATRDATAKKGETAAPKNPWTSVKNDTTVTQADEAAPDAEGSGTKKDVIAATNDTSIQKRPEAAVAQDEKISAEDAGEQIEAQAVVPFQISTKALVVPLLKKPGSGAAAVEGKKQRGLDDGVAVVADAKPQAEAVAAPADLIVVAAAVIVVESVAPKVEGKAVAKVDAAPVKNDLAKAVSGDASKASAAETKPEAADEKAAPAAEVKANPFETNVVAAVTTHSTAANVTAVETNTGLAQGMIATVVPSVTHKSEAHTVASAELQSAPLAAGGAEVQALAVGPGQLEVGVLDGTHGWLKIRAELGSDGLVSASLTSTATAHEGLREAVPELATYLSSESVNVGRIAVHQAAESSAAGGDLTNAGGGSGARDGGAGRGYQGSGKSMVSNDSTQQDVDSVMSGLSAAVFGAGARYSGNGIGSWLSVTA